MTCATSRSTIYLPATCCAPWPAWSRAAAPADLLRVVQALLGWLRDPRAGELRRAFVDWVRQMAERLAPAGTALPVLTTLEDAKVTLVERVGEWPAQWLREGREEGREQGLAHERALLCRMTETRFGTGAADRLAALLAPITDPDHLADVGDWLVRCDSAEEFLAQIASSASS